MKMKVNAIHGTLPILAVALLLAAVLQFPLLAIPLTLFASLGTLLFLRKYRVTVIWPNFWRGFWSEELGAVGVNYFIRGGGVLINGSATPPTAAQASAVYTQKAQIILADSDVQALFTHNWGLDASSVTYLDPEISYYAQLLAAAGTSLAGFTFDVSNTNVVKCNKLNFLGSGGTFIVTLRKGTGPTGSGPWQ